MLDRNLLTGDFPREMKNLRFLEHLDMAAVNCTGNLFDGLPDESLRYVNVAYSTFGGIPLPNSMSRFTNLEHIRFQEAHLNGTIPTTLGLLTKLTLLDLWVNDLTGPVPSELGLLTKLSYLDIGTNDLEGSLPTELWSLTKLDKLFMDTNMLTGTVPESYCDYPKHSFSIDCANVTCSCCECGSWL